MIEVRQGRDARAVTSGYQLAAHALVRAVAACGLPGAPVLPPGPPAPALWAHLVRAVRGERLAGHLAQAVAGGQLSVTDAQREQVAELHSAGVARVLLLERLLLDVSRRLENAAIDYRVLKGPALARLAYPDAAQRLFGDVDLLVPSDRIDDAVRLLTAAGCRRVWPELRPGFDRRFGKGATLVHPGGDEVDLHRTLALGPFGLTIQLQDLFSDVAWFELAGRLLPALPREELLLHACYHAALGSSTPRLVPLRDVAQLLLTGPVDTGRVLDLSRRWGGQVVVARALALAWDVLQLSSRPPLVAWAEHYVEDPAEQRALASYLRADGSYAAKALASVRVLPGVRQKSAFLLALLLPQAAALHRYEAAYARWWRRGAAALLARGGSR